MMDLFHCVRLPTRRVVKLTPLGEASETMMTSFWSLVAREKRRRRMMPKLAKKIEVQYYTQRHRNIVITTKATEMVTLNQYHLGRQLMDIRRHRLKKYFLTTTLK